MSDGIEAAGDILTGAVVSRAVEPGQGQAQGDRHGTGHGGGVCLNCGSTLVGTYCHACGQNSHIHRTLAGFGHDLLHGVFHFEGKIWRTLPMLVWRPGELTWRYIHGERAKFVSPLAIFLFCVFLLYAIVGSIAGEMHAPEVQSRYSAKSVAELQAELKTKRAERDALTVRMRAVPPVQKGGAAYDAMDSKRDDIDNDIDALELAEAMLDPAKKAQGVTVFSGLRTGWAPLDAGIKKANQNPNLFFYKLQTSAYKYSWALIPISMPLVWLLFFWKRRYKFYDHLVFVTYSLTFMSLLVVVLTVLSVAGVPTSALSLAGMIIPPIHSYRQLRGAYHCRRFPALVRTFLLMIMGSVALITFVLLLLALGLMHKGDAEALMRIAAGRH